MNPPDAGEINVFRQRAGIWMVQNQAEHACEFIAHRIRGSAAVRSPPRVQIFGLPACRGSDVDPEQRGHSSVVALQFAQQLFRADFFAAIAFRDRPEENGFEFGVHGKPAFVIVRNERDLSTVRKVAFVNDLPAYHFSGSDSHWLILTSHVRWMLPLL
ncbi:MAG: hypothetical protein M3Q69_08480 [Acidobacteriota bacterium]|nr:hypothetical protein [Acidobacteriota bacterium]